MKSSSPRCTDGSSPYSIKDSHDTTKELYNKAQTLSHQCNRNHAIWKNCISTLAHAHHASNHNRIENKTTYPKSTSNTWKTQTHLYNKSTQSRTHTQTQAHMLCTRALSRIYHMLCPTNIPCRFQEVPTVAVQLPSELIHASTLISKQAHPLQRWIPRQPIQNTGPPIETIPWQECSMQNSRNPLHKHRQIENQQNEKKIHTYTKKEISTYSKTIRNWSRYQEQSYGTRDTVNRYRAHYHLLYKDFYTAHMDCDFQATSLHIDTAAS